MSAVLTQSCPQGMTGDDLRDLLGGRCREFWRWMRGQTMSLCDGMEYNHEERKYVPTACFGRPHGVIVYSWDVERFLRGLPVID